MKQTNRKSPPPHLARLAAILLLALPAGPAMAEQCDASHIKVTKVFPLGPLNENDAGGTIISFELEGCDNLGSTGMPRDYRIHFCAEIFDSTPCNANETDCLANNVAGARGILGDTFEVAGEFKVCTHIATTELFQNALVIPYNNDFVDVGQNAIFVIMRNPTRVLHIPIMDDDD